MAGSFVGVIHPIIFKPTNMKSSFTPPFPQAARLHRMALILITLMATLIPQAGKAQCPPGGVILNNQTQVNAFLANYPNCTQINGILVINPTSSGAITDLSPLSNITTVAGYIHIENLGGVSDLSALNNITSVGGTVTIVNSQGLTAINSFNNLTNITGGIHIQNNHGLTTLNAFNALSSVSVWISINNNDALSTMNAFYALDYINGNLVVVENNSLSSVADFSALSAVNGFVHIERNGLLTSIFGLHNINPSTITFLYLVNHPLLSDCDIYSVCHYLQNSNNYLIHSNRPGCNSKAEITATCVYTPTYGCTDIYAHNYDPAANLDDGSCETCTDGIQNGDETGIDCGGARCPVCPEIPGCTDISAHNYDPAATVDDGSCETCSDGIKNGDESGVDCGGTRCDPCPIVFGCTDPEAHNFNPAANIDNGTCETCHDGILNGDETGIDCGGSLCPAECPQPPVANCADLTIYVDPDNPDHDFPDDDEDIYLPSSILFFGDSHSDAPVFYVTVKRASDWIKHDWTTQGACEDGLPDGKKRDEDKGKVLRHCLPVAGEDIDAGPRDYFLHIWDVYGAGTCEGTYVVQPVTYANLARPQVHYHQSATALPAQSQAAVPDEGSIAGLRALPNPGVDEVELSWQSTTDELMDLVIADLSGRVMSSHRMPSQAGANLVRLDMDRFAPGLYVFILRTPTWQETIKWIKSE